ncbi:hypothetical protein VI817_009329 [Penicillium citrinum]|nr:hypothetical protein VI817_009329 [Penicillium citrinum]
MSGEFPPVAALPQLTLHPSVNPEEIKPAEIINGWLQSFVESLEKGDISGHFLDKESWWRDFITFSWDIVCHNGTEAISNYLIASKVEFSDPKADQIGALQPQLVDLGGLRFIQSGFSFKTKFGTGKGVLRLASVGPDQWKAWTVFTVLEKLHEKADEQSSALNHGADDPQVLIASQPGEAWRDRYNTIKLHTPLYADHYPFLKYPSNWPLYLDQEHITKWMEHYQHILGLKVRYDTLVDNVVFNESAEQYSVELRGKHGVETIYPQHVVLATGILSNIPVSPQFPGQDLFKGEVRHTSEFRTAASIPDVQNKRITIIGAGTSAHDVAQDLVNHGAKHVTMVQRGRIFVTSLNSLENIQTAHWNSPGVSTDDADLLGNSFPIPVTRTLSIGASQMMSVNDKDLLDGLEKAGMALKKGDEGDSLLDHQLIKAGHFYIDQGASPMIVDGRIKIKRCEKGVQEFYEDGIVLADGTKIESDIVILATGFERCTKTIEGIMGEEFMSKVGEICGLDENQERIGTWRPSGMPGFWFMTGSFMWARQFAPVLALQIAAIERGLNSYKA